MIDHLGGRIFSRVPIFEGVSVYPNEIVYYIPIYIPTYKRPMEYYFSVSAADNRLLTAL